MVATSFKTLTFAAAFAAVANAALLQRRSQSGRATFYDVGMGNCGWSSSASDSVVALNTAQYGSTSSVSGTCGQTITIYYQGNSAQAKIVDSCPTCPYGGLDLSRSLFSQLTNGNMGLGQVQVTWDWGSGGGSSNSNSNNQQQQQNNDQQQQQQQQTTTSSSSTTSATPTATSTSTPSASTPTNTAEKVQTGAPEWWATVGNAGCEKTALPEGAQPVGIAPSGNAELADLPAACGKWVQITNLANNKSTKGVVTTYLPGSDRNAVILADAYKQIADMNGDAPNPIESVKWGFLN